MRIDVGNETLVILLQLTYAVNLDSWESSDEVTFDLAVVKAAVVEAGVKREKAAKHRPPRLLLEVDFDVVKDSFIRKLFCQRLSKYLVIGLGRSVELSVVGQLVVATIVLPPIDVVRHWQILVSEDDSQILEARLNAGFVAVTLFAETNKSSKRISRLFPMSVSRRLRTLLSPQFLYL